MKLTTCVSALLLTCASAIVAQNAIEERKFIPTGMHSPDSYAMRRDATNKKTVELKIPASAIPDNFRFVGDEEFRAGSGTADFSEAEKSMNPQLDVPDTENLISLVNSDMPWIYPTGVYSISRTVAPASYPQNLLSLSPTFNLYGVVAGDEFITCEPAIYGTSSFLGVIFNAYDAVTLRHKRKYQGADYQWFYTAAYNEKDGMIYSPLHHFDEDMNYSCSLVRMNPSDLSFTEVKSYGTGELIPTTIAFSPDGTLYSVGSKLSKIDIKTGAETIVGETGINPGTTINAAAFADDGTMYYAFSNSSVSGLYTIDTSTGKATKIYQFPRRMEIHSLFAPVPAASDNAPDYVTDVKYDFPKNKLEGKVSFKAPVNTFDGNTTLAGTLKYHILADETELVSGNVNPGQTVNADVKLDTYGRYCIIVYVEDANGIGPKTEYFTWIGIEPPSGQIFSEFSIDKNAGKMHLKWQHPQSINYTELDKTQLEYKVTRLPDSVVVRQKEVELHQDVPDNGRKYYRYLITPIYFGIEFEESTCNTVPHAGGDIILPYTEYFDSNASLEDWSIIDSDNDGYKWRQSGGAIYIPQAENGHDDWLVTPKFRLEKGRMYDFSFMGSSTDGYVDMVQLKLGSTQNPADMNIMVKDKFEITENDGKRFSATYRCDKSGEYYLGIHAISDSRGHYLYLDDITVSAGFSPEAPAAVSDLSCEADIYGDSKVTITFTSPSLSVSGNQLTAPAVIKVYRESELIATLHPAKGTKTSWTDENVPYGDVRYLIAASDGDSEGGKAETECFVGHTFPGDIPGIVTEKIGQNTMHFEWQPVTSDRKGKLYRQNVMQYEIYDMQEKKVIDFIPSTDYSYRLSSNSPQGFFHFRVCPVASEKYGNQIYSDMINLGPAYELPFADSFANGKINHAWATRRTKGGGFGRWNLYGPNDDAPSADGDGFSAAFHNENGFTEEGSRYYSGVIQLPNEMKNPVFSFAYLCMRPDDYNHVCGVVREEGEEEWTTLFDGECTGDWEWKYAYCNLAKYLGKKIQVGVEVELTDYAFTFIDDLSISSQPDDNLVLKDIYAVEKVRAGEEGTVYVQVENRGRNRSTPAFVEFYLNDNLEGDVPVPALDSNQSEILEFSYPTNAATPVELRFLAVVRYEKDEIEDDNSMMSNVVTMIQSLYPAPTNLRGSLANDRVLLEWDMPDMSDAPAIPSTYDFEELGNLQTSGFGKWKTIDGDRLPCGGINGIPLDGIDGKNRGFFVFDSTDSRLNDTFATHSGTKCMMSMFVYDYAAETEGKVDDWLVSPRLCGKEQKFSFWAKSYSSVFPETLQVFYSTDGTTLNELREGHLVGELSRIPSVWTEYTFDLPAEAKYVAIRNTSVGGFLLMIDDITVSTEDDIPENLELVNYRVYKNNVLLKTGNLIEPKYEDVAPSEADGNVRYYVTAVFDKGESKRSNETEVNSTSVSEIGFDGVFISALNGEVNVKGAVGKRISISGVDGKCVYDGIGSTVTRIPVDSGVYVVSVSDKSYKLIVN